jgi:hypothetical protein
VNRGLLVGESGRCSAATRPRLRRALGRDMLAGPRRRGTEGQLDGLTRAGRCRAVAPTRRGKEVAGGAGARRRRSVVCDKAAEAAREHAPRERLVAWVRAALPALDTRQAEPPKNAGARMAARRGGRYLPMEARGRLRIHAAQGAAAATYAGPCVVTTTADPLAAPDGALGQTRRPRIAGGFRQMKSTGLQTRPIAPWRPHRRSAPVKLWGLAWRRQRAAARRCQQTGRTIRQTLAPWNVVRSRRHGKTIGQSSQVTAPLAAILPSLGRPVPNKSWAGSA